MGDQARAIYGVIVHPKATFLVLPARRMWALAILAPLYFGVGRAFHPRRYSALREWLGGDMQIVLVSVIAGVVMIPTGAWLIRQVLKLFKKRLSVIKLMNIYGYALVPRLIVACISYLIILLSNQTLMTTEKPSTSLIVVMVLGFSAIIYTIVLYVYGIVVCPSEEKVPASKGENRRRYCPCQARSEPPRVHGRSGAHTAPPD